MMKTELAVSLREYRIYAILADRLCRSPVLVVLAAVERGKRGYHCLCGTIAYMQYRPGSTCRMTPGALPADRGSARRRATLLLRCLLCEFTPCPAWLPAMSAFLDPLCAIMFI